MESTNSTEPGLVENFVQNAHMYYPPILVFLGTLGNCLSVVVIFSTKMSRSSSSYYLAALAISDTGFLVPLFVVWLNLVGIGIFNLPGYCQFFIYISTLCSFLSVWFVVAFTVERFVAVRYPLRKQSMCTIERAKLILMVITIFGVILCSPVLWLSNTRSWTPEGQTTNITTCVVIEERKTWASVFNVSDTILTFVLPFTIIVVLNSLIVKSVRRFAGIGRSMTSTGSSRDEKSSTSSSRQQVPNIMVNQIKVTKMLLIVSTVFLCFNLPAYVIRVYVFLLGNEEPSETIGILQHAFNLLFDTNFGINFVLYCASGQNFRNSVVCMIRNPARRKNDTRPRASLRTNQSGCEFGRTGSMMGHQRTIIVKIPWEDTCELSTLSRNDEAQNSKHLIDQTSIKAL